MNMYNYRTREYDMVNKDCSDYSDYIPQIGINLYRCYIAMGRSPIDACILTLKACAGEE